MQKLSLLLTKDGLQYQLSKNRNVQHEQSFFMNEETGDNFVSEKLDEILAQKNFQEISVISALNHFTLMPENFSDHESGYDLIAYNSAVEREKEELMLSVNKKFGVQFYYTFPNDFYQKIKSLNLPTKFNFSGEKDLELTKPNFTFTVKPPKMKPLFQNCRNL